MATNNKLKWPVLKHYDQEHTQRISLPLGGIGTGTVSLGGRGELRDWEIVNRPAKGFLAGRGGNKAPFFALYAEPAGGKAVTRALMGPVLLEDYECEDGRKPPNHGLPRFQNCSFDAAYPFGQVNLSDKDVPVAVTVQGFNPLVPTDPDASGIPVAVLRYVLKNKTAKTVTASVCGSMDNFNCFRSYVLGTEAALLMASYPYKRPKFPFPYFTEVMTGFEHTAAVGMLYEGQTKNGLKCIKDIRDRYDGRKRSPFDEAECGHHYARAMASWAAVLALTGFHYSAVDQSMTFNADEGTFFWSTGYAYGTVTKERKGKKLDVRLNVLNGKLKLKTMQIEGVGEVDWS